MKDEFLKGLLFRLNDATKPVDAADRNLVVRALSNSTQGADARIAELEADIAENDALIDSLREQLAARATPADHSRDSVDAKRWRWLLGEHFPTAENPPLAQVLWKQSNKRHGRWVNMIDGNDLKAHVDAAIELRKK